MYFPRLIVPASAVITSFVDFLISFVILAGLMLWYQWWPSWRLLTLPLWVAVAFAASFGAGLWLASLNVQYRDFRYVVPFLVQFGLYVSPVGFSSAIVPEKWQLLFALNPMVGVIEGFRWAIIGRGAYINPLLHPPIPAHGKAVCECDLNGRELIRTPGHQPSPVGFVLISAPY